MFLWILALIHVLHHLVWGKIIFVCLTCFVHTKLWTFHSFTQKYFTDLDTATLNQRLLNHFQCTPLYPGAWERPNWSPMSRWRRIKTLSSQDRTWSTPSPQLNCHKSALWLISRCPADCQEWWHVASQLPDQSHVDHVPSHQITWQSLATPPAWGKLFLLSLWCNSDILH